MNQFQVGEQVEVLNAIRLPKVEQVIHAGTVRKITASASEPLYWIEGRLTAVTAKQLRRAR